MTTVARTLFDISPTLTTVRLESAIDVAESRQLGGSLALVDLLERYPRRPGAAAIRRILAAGQIGTDMPREELELRQLHERPAQLRRALGALLSQGL